MASEGDLITQKETPNTSFPVPPAPPPSRRCFTYLITRRSSPPQAAPLIRPPPRPRWVSEASLSSFLSPFTPVNLYKASFYSYRHALLGACLLPSNKACRRSFRGVWPASSTFTPPVPTVAVRSTAPSCPRGEGHCPDKGE
ncbi:hypothetical protein E2C01_100993 [Portunus trituberculatus]|uniref:Uncharacterized protein n=1 Tax=Portunus trituberculatus TaxID=210409 RepID=A0A5B7K8E3_PORTR|nr:hypothetical protein [Portunus trituberculatus]